MHANASSIQRAIVFLLGTAVVLNGSSHLTYADNAPPNRIAFVGSVPTGTTFNAQLQTELSTAKNRDQDRFTLKEHHPLVGGNALLKDARIEAHLENVVKAARGKKASLHIVFDDIILKDGTRLPLDATLVNTKLETQTQSHMMRNVATIVSGAVAGHYLGQKTGIHHGGMMGAASAAAFVFTSPGGDVVLHKGTDFKIKLNSPLQSP
jgi:hypothetical protein